MPDWSIATHADGPKLAAWFQSEHPPRLDPSMGRRLSAWRAGQRPSIWTVDTYLTRIGWCVTMVPDDCWLVLERDPRGERKNPSEQPELRYCSRCGKPIPRRKPSGSLIAYAAYAKRQWCGGECKLQAALELRADRECMVCGRPIPVRDVRGKLTPKEQVTCGKRCAARHSPPPPGGGWGTNSLHLSHAGP